MKPLPYSQFHMPWMSYLPAAAADDLDLPPDIITERTADGGVLMIATTQRFDPTNPVHLARSRQLAAVMIDRIGDTE